MNPLAVELPLDAAISTLICMSHRQSSRTAGESTFNYRGQASQTELTACTGATAIAFVSMESGQLCVHNELHGTCSASRRQKAVIVCRESVSR